MNDETNAGIPRTREQQALQTSETRYRRLFETARDGILILNAETGAITDVNPFMVELLGYSRNEFLGKELWEIGLFKERLASQAAFRDLQENGYIRYEGLPLETKAGALCEVEFISNVYQEAGHTVIQCNIRDITARKRAEAAQRKSEERFHVLVEGVKDHAVLCLTPRGASQAGTRNWRGFGL
jgi:PAS domain S-box-containing protein